MRIEADNITFSYKEHVVLRGLEFSAGEGDVVAILGPNGVGKSTFFRCLLGFIRPQKGEIYINGKNIRDMNSVELAKHIAYIPQTVSPIFNYTVEDIVLMGMTNQIGVFETPGWRETVKVREALEKLGIGHLAKRGVQNISGGERQLAILARALVQNAEALILDEPTANLDYGNSWRVMERIVSLAKRGYTVLFSTHDPNHAFMHANKVLVLEDGSVMASGSPREVINGELLSKLYNINVMVHKISFENGEELVSLPYGRAKSAG